MIYIAVWMLSIYMGVIFSAHLAVVNLDRRFSKKVTMAAWLVCGFVCYLGDVGGYMAGLFRASNDILSTCIMDGLLCVVVFLLYKNTRTTKLFLTFTACLIEGFTTTILCGPVRALICIHTCPAAGDLSVAGADHSMREIMLTIVMKLIVYAVIYAIYVRFWKNLIVELVTAVSGNVNGYIYASGLSLLCLFILRDYTREMGLDPLNSWFFAIFGVFAVLIMSAYWMMAYSIRWNQRAMESVAMEKSRTEFLERMSHEIRTPLNAVLGFNELIARETDDSTIRDYSQQIKAAGDALMEMVTDLLDFSLPDAESTERLEVIMQHYTEEEAQLHHNQPIYAPTANVLIVDDIAININVFKGLLKKSGIQIDSVDNGQACVDMAATNSYDLIFVDQMMPGMDGTQTMKAIRRAGLNTKTPVVVLTANAISGARESFLAEGFDEFIAKPIDVSELEAILYRFIPSDKIQTLETLMGQDNPVEAELPESELVSESPDTEFIAALKAIEEINVSEGIRYSGSEDIYEEVASIFYLTAQEKIGLIRELWETGEVKDYTIQVHALKSSARLLGAEALSQLALSLEMSGRDEDMEAINEGTPRLLDWYQRLFEALGQYYDRDRGLPEIERAKLDEGIEVIVESVKVFDFDTADMVMRQFENYSMPEDFKEKYQKLKNLMAEVARDDIIELLS